MVMGYLTAATIPHTQVSGAPLQCAGYPILMAESVRVGATGGYMKVRGPQPQGALHVWPVQRAAVSFHTGVLGGLVEKQLPSLPHVGSQNLRLVLVPV